MIELFLLVLLISVVTAFVMLARLWPLRSAPGAAGLILSNLAVAIWSLGYLLEILRPALHEKLLWARLEYLGIAYLSVWFLFFVLAYTGRAAKIPLGYMAAFLVIPTLTVVFTMTNAAHGWVWPSVRLQTGLPLAPLAVTHGWWFWVHSAYSYLVLLASTLLLFLFARGGQKLYSAQSKMMLAALLTPWISNIVYVSGLNLGPGLDFTPITFAITNLLLVLAFVRFRLFDIRPVAYTSIFQAINDGVVVFDHNDRVVDFNPAAQRIFEPIGGVNLGEGLGISTPSGEEGQEVTLGAGLDRRTYLLRSTPLPSPLQQRAGRLAILADITERKQAEEKLRQAHQESMEANKLKTQLLANISHDLRTPLGAIIGYTEMLHEGVYGQMSADQRQIAGEIIDSTNQVLMFVNNLIGQAQLETGRVQLVPRAFPVNELVEEPRTMVGLMARKKGLTVEYEIDPVLPSILYGDPYWLRQLILNLVTNAIKFTEKGCVKVRLFKSGQDHWAIEVTDTGIGIPENVRDIIFEPFYQIDSNAPRHTGSGLGLSIVRDLAFLMGGSIQVQSSFGTGSTFIVTLPDRNTDK